MLFLSLENSVGEKNMYAHERDKKILSLQKEIQELKVAISAFTVVDMYHYSTITIK